MTDYDPFGSIPIAGEKQDQPRAEAEPRVEERGKPVAEAGAPPAHSARDQGRARSTRRQSRPGWRWLACLALLPVATLVLYITAGFLLGPLLLRAVLPAYLTRITDRPVAVDIAEFDPLRLTITLLNTTVGPGRSEAGSRKDPFFSCSRLELDLSAASLVKLGLICKRVEAEGLSLHLVRSEDGSYNFQNFFRPPGGRWLPFPAGIRFSFNNISARDSRLVFEDRQAGKTHTVEELHFALPALANVAFRPDQYLTPRFSAKINGSPLELAGETRIEAGELEARLKLRLTGIELPACFAYLPVSVNFLPASGRADLDLDLIFSSGVPDDSRLRIEGTGRLIDLRLQSATGPRELARVPEVTGTIAFSPWSGRYTLREVHLQQPEFHLERQSDGSWLFPRLDLETGNLELERLTATNGRLSFVDHRVKGGFADTWSELQLSMEGWASGSRKPASFALSGRNRQQTSLSAQGRYFPDRYQAEGMLIGHNLRLPALNAYLEESRALRFLDGQVSQLRAGFASTFKEGGPAEFSCTGLTIRMENLTLAAEEEPWLQVPRLTLDEVSLQWPGRQLTIGKIVALGGSLLLDWDEAGRLNWTSKSREGEEKSGWRVAMQEGSLEGTALLVRARTFPELLTLDFQQTRLNFANLGNQEDMEGRVSGSSRLHGTSPVEIAGALQLQPLSARLDCRLEDLSLERLRPLFKSWFHPTIRSGVVRAAGELRMPGPVFRGALRVDQFAAARQQKEILRWRTAASDDVTVRFSPASIQADAVVLHQPFLLWTPAGRSGSSPGELFALSWMAEGIPRVQLGQLLLADGELTFADHAATPPFSLAIQGISGSIDSLVSTGTERGQVRLKGRDSRGADYELRGGFNLFNSLPLADLAMEVRSFQLAALSPYLSDSLGYRLTGGTVDLITALQLEGPLLQASNRLRINGLQLGEPLAKASHLPLALALLTDGEDRIELDIPVSGRFKTADFSYREELRRTVRHLLLRSAVSPFSVLMESTSRVSLADSLTFPPGESQLTVEMKDQLQVLAAALSERPRLRLLLQGLADGGSDREAIRARLEEVEKIRQSARDAEVSSRLAGSYGREVNQAPPEGADTRAKPRAIVSDDQLQALAASRSEAVQHHLSAVLQLPAARVSIAPVGRPTPPDGTGRPCHRVDIELRPARP